MRQIKLGLRFGLWSQIPSSSEAGKNACRISFLRLWLRTEGSIYNKQQPELRFGLLLLPSVFQCPKAWGPLHCSCTRGAKIIAILSVYLSTQYMCVWRKFLVLGGCLGTACFLRATKHSHPRFFLKVFNKKLILVISVLFIDSYW